MEKIVYKRTPRKWTSEKVEFLKKNFKNMDYREISDNLGMTYNAISHKTHSLNLDSRDLWTEKENNLIKDEYSYNPNIWSLLPNRSREAISVQARKLGVQRRCGNYDINFRFFENWTSASAYVIGFFLADGCVESRINRISCELSMKDYDHLIKIRNLMDSKNPICIKKTRNSCALFIHNAKMVSDIIQKGVIPNKTTRVRLPEIPNEYLRDVIRGYFDGDGSIWFDNGYKRISFLGNLGFIIDIEKIINNLGCSKKIPRIHNKGSDKCYNIKYSSKNDLDKIFQFMYYDNCFSLVRKTVLARGVIPGKINSTQISQVISLPNEEPERKTDKNQISAQRLNVELS